jgi:1-phosphofructokinase
MTAGLAVGVQRGLSLEQSSALGAAAGALNVTRHGLASGHAATIEHIAARVVVQSYDATHR